MENLTREIKNFAQGEGADLVGIATMDRFAELPPEHHPASIFPEAKSVIMVGRRILRGSLRGNEEGTNLFDYLVYGYNWLERDFIPLLVYRLTQFIEDQGWEAVPLYPYPTEVKPEGIAVAPDKPAPNVTLDFNLAAVAAGLGEIGYGDVFLSPEYGTRQRFGMIITDAELEADPLFTGTICDRCEQCVKDCPLGAMSRENGERTVNIAGRSFTVAAVDYEACGRCKNGAEPNTFHPEGRPDRLGAICMRSCVHQLEQAGKLGSAFKHPLRNRSPWKRDSLGKVISQGEPVSRVSCFDAECSEIGGSNK
jgi:epoxyqueuosine reductase